ncbi:MAG: hypothetical protein ACP5Q0_06305, partial [Halothiobacillus sp.]
MNLLFSIRTALALVITSALLYSGLRGACAETAAADTPTAPELSCANARFIKAITLTRALIPAPPQDVLNLGAMLGDEIAAT